jgi:predicted small secreted protein
MKNKFKLLGIIAMVALIGFSIAACKTDDDGGGGGIDSAVWANLKDTEWFNDTVWLEFENDWGYDAYEKMTISGSGISWGIKIKSLTSSKMTFLSDSEVNSFNFSISSDGKTLNISNVEGEAAFKEFIKEDAYKKYEDSE